MKTLFLILTGLIIGLCAQAQTTRYVTLFNTNTTATLPSISCVVQTNELVQLYGGDGNAVVFGYCAQGKINLVNVGVCSGLTNIIMLSGNGSLESATLAITTPASSIVISNYVPADAIVIPASANGSAQIILESSPDLVNWTAASPGTYSAANGTNRFFRVRASAN